MNNVWSRTEQEGRQAHKELAEGGEPPEGDVFIFVVLKHSAHLHACRCISALVWNLLPRPAWHADACIQHEWTWQGVTRALGLYAPGLPLSSFLPLPSTFSAVTPPWPSTPGTST